MFIELHIKTVRPGSVVWGPDSTSLKQYSFHILFCALMVNTQKVIVTLFSYGF